MPAHTVGLIVFDEEPELEFFYGDEGDSDVEWAEDDEDENGTYMSQMLIYLVERMLNLTDSQPRITMPPITRKTRSLRTTSMAIMRTRSEMAMHRISRSMTLMARTTMIWLSATKKPKAIRGPLFLRHSSAASAVATMRPWPRTT